jgi:hypothetical protein
MEADRQGDDTMIHPQRQRPWRRWLLHWRRGHAARRISALVLVSGMALGGGLLLPSRAGAALDCQTPADLAPEVFAAGPRHHPVGRPLPDLPTFRQPGTCEGGVWFYDGNGNGRPDPSEPQLYGATKIIACGSCHAESPVSKSPAADSVFLRQDASTLCLVCHNL